MTAGPVIEERQPLVQHSWRALLLVVPLFLLLVLCILSNKPRELLAVGPLFFLLGYAFVAMYLCWRNVRIDHEGFTITHGPIPIGARDVQAATARVRHLFPRHLTVLVARHRHEQHYFATVELDNGQFVDLLGPFRDWQEASAACMEIGTLWRLPEIAAGRSGLNSSDRSRLYRMVSIWLAAFLAAFVWIPLILA